MVQGADDLGWDLLSNGELLRTAEGANFDLMVTADQNISYQQNLAGRRIGLVVLGSNQWPFVRNHLPEIVAAVNDARAGSYAFIEVPLPPKPKYQRTD
jgi:hypothetical protein